MALLRVAVLVVIASAATYAALILLFAPGSWRALPSVQFFESLSPFQVCVALSVLLVLVVTVMAILDARKWKAMDPSVTPLRTHWTRRRFVAALVLPPLFVLVGASLLRGSDGLVIADEWRYSYAAVGILLGGCWLASSFHAFRSPRRLLPWILAGAGIAGSVMEAGAPDPSLIELARVRSADGIGYLLLSKGSWRSPYCYRLTMTIARVRSAWFGLTRYECLVKTEEVFTDYGSPREYPRVVRPEGFESEPGRGLLVSRDGFVASIWGGMECNLAYDTKTSKGYGQWHSIDEQSGQGMETLSPFRLLEAGGRPDPGDVGILESEAAAQARDFATRPPESWPEARKGLDFAIQERSLLAALESRNDLVQAAAGRIIRAGGKALYPEAYDNVR